MSKTSDSAMSGKYALDYVLRKGKGVFLPCFTAKKAMFHDYSKTLYSAIAAPCLLLFILIT